MTHKPKPAASSGRFSDKLEAWLKSPGPKTLGGVNDTFAEKAFAVSILLLMILPALPLPTGGISHVFEVVTIIIAAPLLLGLKTFWLPGFAKRLKLGKLATGKALVALLKLIRKFEKFSRPRYTELMKSAVLRVVTGFVIIGLTLGAMLAPPFVGLDTLPAMGVVAICLGIILEDFVVYLFGVVIGATGIVITITLGAAIVRLVHNLF